MSEIYIEKNIRIILGHEQLKFIIIILRRIWKLECGKTIANKHNIEMMLIHAHV